jgi:hypothetical protein
MMMMWPRRCRLKVRRRVGRKRAMKEIAENEREMKSKDKRKAKIENFSFSLMFRKSSRKGRTRNDDVTIGPG